MYSVGLIAPSVLVYNYGGIVSAVSSLSSEYTVHVHFTCIILVVIEKHFSGDRSSHKSYKTTMA